jgi:hypothetical protein
MTDHCVICPARPPRAPLPDSRACKVCGDELNAALKDLEQLLPVLRALMEPGRALVDSGVRGRRGTAPAPLRVDVLSLLEDTAHSPDVFLTRWGAAFDTAPSPAGLRAALGRIIETDHLEAFTRELRALRAAVVRVCGEPGPAKVATCRRLVRGRECRGAITATPGSETAACTVCGDQWPRARWGLLGRIEQAETG